MPVPTTEYPNTTLFSESRPRANYCWLHGWNNTHSGTTCKVMDQNPAYTHAMKHACGPNGTGGNPRVGVPVQFSRPHFFFSPLPFVCPPCLPSQTRTNFLPLSPPPSQAIKDSPDAYPNDASRARAPTKQSAPFMLQAEGHNPKATRVCDAGPTLTNLEPVLSPSPNTHPLPLSTPTPLSTSSTSMSQKASLDRGRLQDYEKQPMALSKEHDVSTTTLQLSYNTYACNNVPPNPAFFGTFLTATNASSSNMWTTPSSLAIQRPSNT
jgi:hypothetical protein